MTVIDHAAGEVLYDGDAHCPRCEAERRRADAVQDDLDGAWRDVRSKNRRIGALEAELAKQAEADPGAQEVKGVLRHWIEALGKNPKTTKIPLDGKRAKVVRGALKDHSPEECREAIDGLATKRFAGPGGRHRIKAPGTKLFDDIHYALGDESTIERCRGYLADAKSEAEEAEEKLKAKRWELARDLNLPADHGVGWDEDRGIRFFAGSLEHLLHSLERYGCSIREHPNNRGNYSAQCPAHDDRDPSLSIREEVNGKVLIHCFAGCSADSVLSALGLTWQTLGTLNARRP
jgi:hypothetical protein